MKPEPGPVAEEAARVVDARGQRCPMPLLLAKRALNQLQCGERLLVIATDATAPSDFELFSRQSGQLLLSVTERDGEHQLLLEKR